MNQPFLVCENWLDREGRPEGGVVSATGLQIKWQSGPLGRGLDRKEPNGAFVETVITAALQRIEHYQTLQFACDENAQAIEHLRAAIAVLESRTARRENAGVEGTHGGN